MTSNSTGRSDRHSRLSRTGVAAAAGLLVLAGAYAVRADDKPQPAAPAAAPAPAAQAKPEAKHDGKTVNLSERWIKGVQQRLELNIQRRVESASDKLPGASAVQTVDERIGVILRLADVSDKAAIFSLFLTDIHAKVTIGDKEHEFDSSTPSTDDKGNPLAEAMRPLVGATIKVVVNSDGDVASSTGQHNAIVPGHFGLYAEDLIGVDAIRRDWESIFTMRRGVDARAVTLGDTWKSSNDNEVKGVGIFTLATDSAFSDLADQHATVKTEGAYTLKSEVKDNGTTPYSLKDSTYKGIYVWNTDDGLIDNADVTRKTAIVGKILDGEVKITSEAHYVIKRRAEIPKPAAAAPQQ